MMKYLPKFRLKYNYKIINNSFYFVVISNYEILNHILYIKLIMCLTFQCSLYSFFTIQGLVYHLNWLQCYPQRLLKTLVLLRFRSILQCWSVEFGTHVPSSSGFNMIYGFVQIIILKVLLSLSINVAHKVWGNGKQGEFFPGSIVGFQFSFLVHKSLSLVSPQGYWPLFLGTPSLPQLGPSTSLSLPQFLFFFLAGQLPNMAPQKQLPSRRGRTHGSPLMQRWCLSRWEFVANFFDATPLEIYKEIIHLEAKEFVDRVYFLDLEIGGNNLKCALDLRKFHKRRLHFLHSINLYRQLEIILSMVIRDNQVDNYKLFAGQEEIKRILRDIRYKLDDMVVRLTRVECYVVVDSEIESNEQYDVPMVINAPAEVSPHTKSSSTSPIIILD